MECLLMTYTLTQVRQYEALGTWDVYLNQRRPPYSDLLAAGVLQPAAELE